jgi:hypothetical protein
MQGRVRAWNIRGEHVQRRKTRWRSRTMVRVADEDA